MNPTKFHFGLHASQRAKQRGVTHEQMMDAIVSHDQKVWQYDKAAHGGIAYRFIKKYGPRELNVIAEIFKAECYFVTCYWK